MPVAIPRCIQVHRAGGLTRLHRPALVIVGVLAVANFVIQDAHIERAVIDDPVAAIQRPAQVVVNIKKRRRTGQFLVPDAMYIIRAGRDQAAGPKPLIQQGFAIGVDHGDFDKTAMQVCCFGIPDHELALTDEIVGYPARSNSVVLGH